MGGIAHVGPGLVVDADGPEGDEAGVDEEGEERMEDGADEHDAFAEEEEDGEDGDDDVEVCSTIYISRQSILIVRWENLKKRTIDSKEGVP